MHVFRQVGSPEMHNYAGTRCERTDSNDSPIPPYLCQHPSNNIYRNLCLLFFLYQDDITNIYHDKIPAFIITAIREITLYKKYNLTLCICALHPVHFRQSCEKMAMVLPSRLSCRSKKYQLKRPQPILRL